MAKKIKTVSFNITGEFVTKTARDWLYAENRPYEKVIDFLLSAMAGTDLDNKTLIKYANDILEGKKKMTGDTRDNSYHMTDDDTDIIKAFPLYFKNKSLEKYIVEKKDDEDYCSDIIQNLQAYRRRIENRCIEKNITTGDYGWLSPDGKFFEVGWGKHESWAIEYVEKYYPNKNINYAGDFLIEHGWLPLHSPGGTNYVHILSDDIQSATKRQKEFLYDYFLERGRNSEANMIWQEDRNAQD
jgi:hypothetical protein